MLAPQRTLGALLAALCLTAGPLTLDAAARADGDRRSLEELLAEERAAAAAQVEALRPRVETLLSSLSGLGGSKLGDPRVRKIVDELATLGSPGAVLLVEAIEPGPKPTSGSLFVASHVTTALERMPTAAITTRLLTLTTSGSSRARASAVRILGSTGDPHRIGPHLAKLYREAPDLRRVSLEALCLLGGAEANEVLDLLLESDSAAAGEELGAALAALTEALERGRPVNPTMVAFLHGVLDGPAGRELVTELLAHCRALGPERVDEQAARLLVGLAADRMVDRPDRVRLLQALPGLELDWDRKLTDLLDDAAIIPVDSVGTQEPHRVPFTSDVVGTHPHPLGPRASARRDVGLQPLQRKGVRDDDRRDARVDRCGERIESGFVERVDQRNDEQPHPLGNGLGEDHRCDVEGALQTLRGRPRPVARRRAEERVPAVDDTDGSGRCRGGLGCSGCVELGRGVRGRLGAAAEGQLECEGAQRQV